MGQGLALTLGLNSIDSEHYDWNGELIASESDAKDMAKIAETQGFTCKTLLTKECTRSNVIAEIEKAAQTLKKGDFFLLTYSGHGSQLPDRNKDEDKKGQISGEDETWLLYDAQIVDDELNNLYSKFQKGVRILVVSDSCFSGGILKLLPPKFQPNDNNCEVNAPPRVKMMPYYMRQKVYTKNQAFYDNILENPELKDALKRIKASAILLSGCAELQKSQDGDFNSLFTEKLKIIWNDGKFKPKEGAKGYHAFLEAIKNEMPPFQTPCFDSSGKKSKRFENQEPFKI